jgi:N-succinyldiaminopimelate aminotransferase
MTICRDFTFPGSAPSGRSKPRPHLQWRDRAGFTPDFPVMPVTGTQTRRWLYHERQRGNGLEDLRRSRYAPCDGYETLVVNPRLASLQPYPFERLRQLLEGALPPPLSPIRLSIGEPQHPTPQLIRDAVVQHLDGLSVYPLTAGSDRLREAIAGWFTRRYKLPALNATTQVLPVNGTREALFAFAHCIIDPSRSAPLVCCPNPFYQIYEGAALLAGAECVFLNQCSDTGYAIELESLEPATWARVQLLYVCSPGNPTGRVLSMAEWRAIFDLSDRHNFIVASDECYSEIYFDEAAPPLGALEAAHALGRTDFRNLVVFSSLSKRSNAPGLRSGAVAGDARILKEFLRYRTYHGCAMSTTVQQASLTAWGDEAHVRENRARYSEKFKTIVPMLAEIADVETPDAGFYVWMPVPDAWAGDDERFTRDLVTRANVTVLPGRYLARDAHHVNPGAGRVRLALVATLDECMEAARRIVSSCR